MADTQGWTPGLALVHGSLRVATVANPVMPGNPGDWVKQHVTENTMHRVLATFFIAMAVWMPVPDKLGDDAVSQTPPAPGQLVTAVLFAVPGLLAVLG